MAAVLEEPFPLKMVGDVLIIPSEGLPVADKDFNAQWASRTRFVLEHFPDAEGNKLTTYNPQDIKKRLQAGKNAVSYLKKLATKELVDEIATQFTKHGIYTFNTFEDFENTFKIMKTTHFDTDYTTHEHVLKLLYEIVVATWKFRGDWKVKAIDDFCTHFNINYEGDLEKQGSSGVKGNHCFLNIVNASPVRSVRDKFEAAMEKVFGCCIKVHFGDGKYGWGELDISSDLQKSGRCAEVVPVRYKSKNVLIVKSSKAEEKKTKSKNDKTYDNAVTKLARAAIKLLYTPVKVSNDVQIKMNELITTNVLAALPIPSVPPTQGAQLNQLPSAMAASVAASAMVASATMGSNNQLPLAMATSQIYPPSYIQQPIQQQTAFGGMSLSKPPSPIQGKQTQPAPAVPPLHSRQQVVHHQDEAALQVQRETADREEEEKKRQQAEAAEKKRQQAEAAKALQVQREAAEKKRQQAEAAMALQVPREVAACEEEEEERQQAEPAKDRNKFLSEITGGKSSPAAEEASLLESNDTDDDESNDSSDGSTETEVTSPKLGEVGYEVLKLFDDGWFAGKIIETTEEVLNEGERRVRYSDGDSEVLTIQQLKTLRLTALRSSTIPSELLGKKKAPSKKKTVVKSKVAAKKKAQAKATRSKASASSVSSRRQATGSTLTKPTASDIDTSKVKLYSCDNAEKNTYNCVGTVCNDCKVKMVADEEKSKSDSEKRVSSRGKVAHGTRNINDKLKRKAAAMLEEGDLLECKNDHSKSAAFCKEADKKYIVGPYADDVRKGGGCLPTKCCKCGGRFV